MKPDILIKIKYPLNDPEEFEIQTNAKPEVLSELLSDYLRAVHMGAGKDNSPPEEHDIYEIKIGLQVSDDSWGTESNCGNKGLLAGLVSDVLSRLNVGQVKGIKELE